MKAVLALTLLSAGSMAQTPSPPSGGDPPFVSPAVNRAALNDLFKSTGGANWKENKGWGTDSDYCDWYGVTCVYTNHNITTHIRLAQNNLVSFSRKSQFLTQSWVFICFYDSSFRILHYLSLFVSCSSSYTRFASSLASLSRAGGYNS